MPNDKQKTSRPRLSDVAQRAGVSAMTVTRYLGGFVRSQVEHLADRLWAFTLAHLQQFPL